MQAKSASHVQCEPGKTYLSNDMTGVKSVLEFCQNGAASRDFRRNLAVNY